MCASSQGPFNLHYVRPDVQRDIAHDLEEVANSKGRDGAGVVLKDGCIGSRSSLALTIARYGRVLASARK
jgi:hypothetical protein